MSKSNLNSSFKQTLVKMVNQNLPFSFAEDDIEVDDASSDDACAEESVDAGFVSSEGDEQADAAATRF